MPIEKEVVPKIPQIPEMSDVLVQVLLIPAGGTEYTPWLDMKKYGKVVITSIFDMPTTISFQYSQDGVNLHGEGIYILVGPDIFYTREETVNARYVRIRITNRSIANNANGLLAARGRYV